MTRCRAFIPGLRGFPETPDSLACCTEMRTAPFQVLTGTDAARAAPLHKNRHPRGGDDRLQLFSQTWNVYLGNFLNSHDC